MNNVLISNPEKLQGKIERFKKDGLDNLHILSDFDRSFTKCFVDGKRSSTSWAQFRNLELLDQDYRDRSSEMFEHYRPIEISNEISKEEKQKEMKEWWEKHLALLVEKGVSRDLIQEIISRGKIVLREGTKEIFEFLKIKNIPLIFISSGLGDIISGVLEKEGELFGNVHIVSNFFNFGDDGNAQSFNTEVIIDSQNKNEASLEKLDFFNEIKYRKNIILVGDAIEDLRILDGVKHEEAIRIGFLNEEIERDLELFKNSFDIVVLDDGTLIPLLEVLKKL
jgi:5'-nucleotidase